MTRRLFALVAAVTSLTMLASGPALAVIATQDQYQTNYSGHSEEIVGTATIAAQTFTAGVSGQLASVYLYVGDIGTAPALARPNATDTLKVEIRTVSSSLPTSTVLASDSMAVDVGWNTFAFSSMPTLAAGTQYAIVVTPDSGVGLSWGGSCTASDYSGVGQAYVYDSSWESVNDYGTAQDDPSACVVQWAFQTFMIASASTTAPPTSTSAPGNAPDNYPLPLLFAGLFAALAFVSIGRLAVVRR